jgi:hypothetical protein
MEEDAKQATLTEHVGAAETFCTCIREVLVSKIGGDSGYSEFILDFLSFFR